MKAARIYFEITLSGFNGFLVVLWQLIDSHVLESEKGSTHAAEFRFLRRLGNAVTDQRRTGPV